MSMIEKGNLQDIGGSAGKCNGSDKSPDCIRGVQELEDGLLENLSRRISSRSHLPLNPDQHTTK